MSKPRVLIAQPDEVLQIVVAQMLRRKSFECDLVSDGSAVLDRLRENDVDVILLDFALPFVSAFDIIESLRSTRPHLLSRVIGMVSILTPLANVDELPLFAVVKKPIHLRQLLRLVMHCLKSNARTPAAAEPAEKP